MFSFNSIFNLQLVKIIKLNALDYKILMVTKKYISKKSRPSVTIFVKVLNVAGNGSFMSDNDQCSMLFRALELHLKQLKDLC